jgi:heat shock protein HtpX
MQIRNLNPDVQRRHNIRNALHTAVLVVGSAAIMGLLAYSMFGTTGLVVAAVIGAIAMAGLGQVSPRMVLGLYKARPLGLEEAPQLHGMISELASRAKLPAVPKLYYVPTQVLNAFAVGRKEDAAIVVTDGLMRAMNLHQIRGILAHETAHIMNGDLKVMGMADVLNRITSFLSTMGLLGVPLVFGVGVKAPLFGLLLLIFAPTIGGLLQLGLSRAREYDADLDGADLTGDPDGLASALVLLEEKQGAKWESMMLPGSRLPQPSLLRTHPRTEDRIARLRALKLEHEADQTVVRAEAGKPRTSLVPAIARPQVRWHRLGIYY